MNGRAEETVLKTPMKDLLAKQRLMGGFPMRLDGEESKMDRILDNVRPLIIPLFYTLSAILTFKLSYDSLRMESLSDMVIFIKEKTDVTITDFFLLFSNASLGVVNCLMIFASFKYKKSDIKATYSMIKGVKGQVLNAEVSADVQQALFTRPRSWVIKVILYTGVLASVAAIFWGIFCLHSFDGQHKWYHYVVITLFCFITLVSSTGPHFGSSVILSVDVSSMYGLILSAWMQKVKLNGCEKSTIGECKLLRTLKHQVNDTLAPFLFILHVQLLLGGIFCAYGATGYIFQVYNANYDRKTEVDKLELMKLATVYFTSYAMAYGYIMFSLGNIGTRIIGLESDIVQELKDQTAFVDDIGLKQDLNIAAEALEKLVGLRPFDSFEVSNATSLSVLNSLVTFTLVMMQFRVGEN